MFFAYSEVDKNPNQKRKGIKLFDFSHNQESLFSSNLTQNPGIVHGRRISLPEYKSVISSVSSTDQKPLSREKTSSESSEIQDSIISLSNNYETDNFSPSSQSSSLSINRGVLDKVYAVEKKKRQANDLNLQITEADKKRKQALIEKNKEKERANEEYLRYQEQKSREIEENKAKVRDYKALLDVQKAQILDSRANERVGRGIERHFEVPVEHSIDSPNVGYFSNNGRYTKNSPQRLNFNPITGVLKEYQVKRNIFDNKSEESFGGSMRSYNHHEYEDKGKNFMGYGNIIVNNK